MRLMLRSEESRWNPNNVLTNQENNTELLIDKRAALYTPNKSEGGKMSALKNKDRWEWATLTEACFEMTWSRWEWEIIVAACFKMTQTEM